MRAAFVAYILLAATGCAGLPATCTNCMLTPADNEEWVTHVCLSAYPFPNCGRTEVLFSGDVTTPNTEITVEAQVADGSPTPSWFSVGHTTSIDSKTGPPYSWFTYIELGSYGHTYNIWEIAKGPGCTLVDNKARVRAKSAAGNLNSVIADRYNCFLEHPGEFNTYCLAPTSPVARIVTTQNFGQDCTNLINTIRSIEKVPGPPLQEYDAKECTADQEAEGNYFDGAHAHMHTTQNDTAVEDSYENILEYAIWKRMYLEEKKFYETGVCDNPLGCKTGHYLAMVNPQFNRVACGIFITPDKKFHSVQNFYTAAQ